jgi:large subunit ribosomal protein L21
MLSSKRPRKTPVFRKTPLKNAREKICSRSRESLTQLPEPDTLIKFGAATHVSSSQGLRERQVCPIDLHAPHAAQSIGRKRSALHRATLEVFVMYAVIRTGGKQYLVSPGEKLKIETTAHENGKLEFSDILAVSGEEGKFESDLTGAKVLASVVGEGRGDKILVFKLKRKKQYKKMQGHRQNFVEVKINEILVNGKSFKEEAAS